MKFLKFKHTRQLLSFRGEMPRGWYTAHEHETLISADGGPSLSTATERRYIRTFTCSFDIRNFAIGKFEETEAHTQARVESHSRANRGEGEKGWRRNHAQV